MRRLFRLIGGIRFVIGILIIGTALFYRDQIGEVWAGIAVLIGSMIAFAGLAVAYIVVALWAVFPFVYLWLTWLVMESWDETWFSDYLRSKMGLVYFFWGVCVILAPFIIWQSNKTWFYMVRHFSLDADPTDIDIPELQAIGSIVISGEVYFGAATITDQGLILDRRNFAPVVLPWKWVRSVKPDTEASAPTAIVALKNDGAEQLSIDVPWNPGLLELRPDMLAEDRT